MLDGIKLKGERVIISTAEETQQAEAKAETNEEHQDAKTNDKSDNGADGQRIFRVDLDAAIIASVTLEAIARKVGADSRRSNVLETVSLFRAGVVAVSSSEGNERGISKGIDRISIVIEVSDVNAIDTTFRDGPIDLEDTITGVRSDDGIFNACRGEDDGKVGLI